MDSKEAKNLLAGIEPGLAKAVRGVDLLGEVAIREDYIEAIGTAIRHFPKTSRERWPHSFAVTLIGVARYRFDGDKFWAHFEELTGIETHGTGATLVGQWFERYLARNHLPRFRHLTDEGALRYLTPILAHALIPRALVPAYMEHVVWPALNGSSFGQSPVDIQRHLAARRPPQIPRPVQRFVAHGGAIARDILERSMAAAASAQGESVNGLPAWLDDEIHAWLNDRPRIAPRAGEPVPRQRPPSLRYDPEYGRVLLELPHLAERAAGRWLVTSQDGRLSVQAPALPPPWERTGSATTVEVDHPFRAITVALHDQGRDVRTWTFHGPSQANPLMLFAETRRLINADGYLPGDRWYALRPDGARITGARVEEAYGSPAGAWQGFTVELISAEDSEQLVTDYRGQQHVLRIVQEPATARLVESDLPTWLQPADDAIVAFEHALPVVRLPATDLQAAEEYLQRWTLRLHQPGSSEEHVRSAAELQPTALPGGEFEVRLEELIPGRDIGNWQLDVSGPLGRGFTSQLQLLPELSAEVDERIGLAGPDLPPAKVTLHTRDGIRVLEHGDSASRSLDGWVLRDENRNGRIPFELVDERTGRAATAMIRLPVVQWQWTGTGAADAPNTPTTIHLDDLHAPEPPRLMITNPGAASLRLLLVDHAGNQLQEKAIRPLRNRGEVIPAAEFVTTVRESQAPSARLALAMVGGSTNDEAVVEVGRVSRVVLPEDVEAEFTQAGPALSWVQSHSFDDTRCSLVPLSRPWAPALSAEVVVLSNGRHGAGFSDGDFVPGRYALELSFNDAWVGATPLGPAVEFVAGSPAELINHIRGLAPSGEATLEHALLASSAEERERVLGEAADRTSPAELAVMIHAVAGAMELGRAEGVLALPWTRVGASLARLRIDPAPLLSALGLHPAMPGVGRFCVALAMDRWQNLRSGHGPLSDDLRSRVWQAWAPLGAFCDLVDIPVDPEAAIRAEDGLGLARLGETSNESLVEELGRLRGPEFTSKPATVAAMRASMSPLPGRLFDPDGWPDATLSALESLGDQDADQFDADRDEWIQWYDKEVRWTEERLVEHLGFDWLSGRNVDVRIHPSAYLARISLVTALHRRLLAHGDRAFLPDHALDELALWLQTRLGRIYERDLCFAEFIYARTFAWPQ